MTYRVDHILDLGLCGILASSPHGGVQLLGGDRVIFIIIIIMVIVTIFIITITIFVSYLGRNGPVHIPVEHVKRLLERLQLVWTKFLYHSENYGRMTTCFECVNCAPLHTSPFNFRGTFHKVSQKVQEHTKLFVPVRELSFHAAVV